MSSSESTKIHIENYDYKSIDFSISRNDFIEYCQKIFDEFKNILINFIGQSKVNKKEISEVILIGGSTLIPKVREIVKEVFVESNIKDNLDQKEVVAMGAAIRAGKKSKLPSVEDINLFDVTNLPLGIREFNNTFTIIIPRSSKLPCNNKKNFKTTNDNQPNALIEVYEGLEKKDCNKKNLFLGKFEISGFPKKKKGEVKIEVKLEVELNSILKVSAMDISNPNLNGNITITKLNDLPKIMDKLKGRIGLISFFESQPYNEIKFSIIEFEEEIRKKKSKKIDKGIKLAYKNMIEMIGNFLINYSSTSALYISFIKFYFKKLCEFYSAYFVDDTNEIQRIKENIAILFGKFECELNKKEILLEIIEESIDEDSIYDNFIDLIMQSLWEEIHTIFYNAKHSEYESSLRELSKTKSLIEISLDLIDKYDPQKYKIKNITKTGLNNLMLKIKVREEIIKYNNKNFFKRIFYGTSELRELYDRYSVCPNYDKEDLEKLGEIISLGNKNKNNNLNLDDEIKKAREFNQLLGRLENKGDINEYIFKILETYPYS